jgi:hypothetical protein
MPTLQELDCVLFDQLRDGVQFSSAKASSSFKRDGIKPELGDHRLAPDMNVGRLVSVQGNEEKPVATHPQN